MKGWSLALVLAYVAHVHAFAGAPPLARPGRLGRARLAADDLAAQFAAESTRRAVAAANAEMASDVLRREAQRVGPEPNAPFSGIKEIVLDDAGRPKAIPRRAPPPPGNSMGDEASELVKTPGFVFGSLAILGAGGLLLAIAASDSATSAGY